MEQIRSFGSSIKTSITRYGVPVYDPKGEDIELCPKETTLNFVGNDVAQPNGHAPVSITNHAAAETPQTPTTPTPTPSRGTPQTGGTSTVWQAGWNVGNCMQGIGILSLPYTVKEGGVASLITMIVVLLIGNYTSKILVYCLYEDDPTSKDEKGKPKKIRVRNSYSDVADLCLPRGGSLLNIMQIVDVTAVAALYLELSGALLVDTFPFGFSKLAWTVISALVLLPTIFFRNLTRISWLSFVAILSLVAMFMSVVWYSLGRSVRWEIDTVPPFKIQSFSVSASIILFNFGTQFIMPGVEESMADRTQFNKVLNITYVITGVLNILYALFAFLTFAENTHEFITYNMPLGPIQATVSSLFVIKSMLSYPLMLFIVVNSVDAMELPYLPPCYNPDGQINRLPPIWAMIFRGLLVAFTLFLAVCIPHFTLLMGVTGSLTSPWLDFIFPSLFYMKLKRHKLRLWEISLNWVIVVIGFIEGLIGLIYSLMALILAYMDDFDPNYHFDIDNL
ncbi:vesicular inhibitory amino acid transporter-like [Amphiura filiformis]|uniref:vesicular inhibitory amino acid transporter-like n=1 Tax=Amphiura filiformis TaxID=82378 RepID=UPI003B21F9C6